MSYVTLALVIALVVLALYVRSYYTYPETTAILQTSMSDFSFDQVLQKQLLVIDDTHSTKDVDIICEAWFRLNYIIRFELTGCDAWYQNRFKYLIMQAHDDDTEVFFFPPGNTNIDADGAPEENENVVAIQMSAHQSVIVPLHWRYMIPVGAHLSCIGIHDLITYFT